MRRKIGNFFVSIFITARLCGEKASSKEERKKRLNSVDRIERGGEREREF
jgi:hypothetical protein